MGNEHNPYQAPASDLALDGPPVDATGQVLAPRGTRFLAAMVDGLISAVAIVPAQYMMGVYDGFPKAKPQEWSQTLVWGLAGIVLYLALHGYMLANSGQTLGKRALGIRIVNVSDGAQTPFATIVTRRLLPQFLAPLIPVVGAILSLVDAVFIFRKDQRCLHDLIAGTKVVRV
jgi:uncharacterized RDD family membrane protein YckC